MVAIAILAPVLWSEQAAAIQPEQTLLPPGIRHWFGTDELGRDVLRRVLVGTRLSLGIGTLAALTGAAAGILLGTLPVLVGGRVGKAIAAAIDTMLAFPALLLALFVAAVLGPGASSALFAIALALTPIFARLTYTLAAGIAAADYVAAARMLGAGPAEILVRHLVPNIAGPLLVTLLMSIGGAILVLSGLSFLGLGVQPPDYDWGSLLNQGFNRIYISPTASIAPAAAIMAAGAVIAALGESLASDLDGAQPASQGRPAAPLDAAAKGCSDVVLNIEGLTIGFGPDPVVHDLSLTIRPGERVGLVGESGSGKTMTARACAGLLPDAAWWTVRRAEFLGQPIAAAGSATQRAFGRHLAFVFQDPASAFNPVLRIGTQLVEGALEHAGIGRRAAQERARQRLETVGIDAPRARMRAYPHQLSGGMLQRAAIASGLMVAPRLLIADEPTTALDVTVQARVLAEIDRVCHEEGLALLLVSHDLAVVSHLCDRVLVMKKGRVVEELAVSSLSQAAHPYTRSLIASIVDLDADRSRPLAAGAVQ
jgi:ABC-type dipeptide/oligopeptide/nickel transport system ATPase component/ABC-type dipeptide/oligopeptide/nickel transport system permease subunit